jgi:hypothetical protein
MFSHVFLLLSNGFWGILQEMQVIGEMAYIAFASGWTGDDNGESKTGCRS